MVPVTYANRGGSYDWESTNSNINVGLTGSARLAANPMSANRISGELDPDEAPGTNNIAAPDGPDGEVQQGYLWNAAIRADCANAAVAGLAVRNYGFMIDVTRYGPSCWRSPRARSSIFHWKQTRRRRI